MNKERRKTLDSIMARIEAVKSAVEKVKADFESLAEDIESVRDEEQEAFDGLPESLQSGERGQAMEHAVSQLDEALDAVRELADLDVDCDAIVTALDEAKAV